MTSALKAKCKGKLSEGSKQGVACCDLYVLQSLWLLCGEWTGQGWAPRTQQDPSGGSCTGNSRNEQVMEEGVSGGDGKG